MTSNSKRAAIYARSATIKTKDAENSIEKQIELSLSYAHQNSYTVDENHVYQDTGAGTSIEHPNLLALRSAIAEKQIDVVIVSSLDRLTREIDKQQELFQEADKQGVTFISVFKQEVLPPFKQFK